MSRQSRRGRRASRGGPGLTQLPWRQIVNPYAPIEVLTEDNVERIHEASLSVLEDLGMEILGDEALDILAAAGADVDRSNSRVRFDRGLIAESIAKAPSTFTLHARNPERNVVLGGNHINFCPVASPPNCSDLDSGRRAGTFTDYCNLLRISQSLNIMHFFGGYPVEPVDLPPQTRHLDCYHAFITLTDRAWHPYSLGAMRCVDGIDMLCIARGVTREQLAREPGLITIVNTNSPLRLDGPMSEGLIEMARAGQAVQRNTLIEHFCWGTEGQRPVADRTVAFPANRGTGRDRQEQEQEQEEQSRRSHHCCRSRRILPVSIASSMRNTWRFTKPPDRRSAYCHS